MIIIFEVEILYFELKSFEGLAENLNFLMEIHHSYVLIIIHLVYDSPYIVNIIWNSIWLIYFYFIITKKRIVIIIMM